MTEFDGSVKNIRNGYIALAITTKVVVAENAKMSKQTQSMRRNPSDSSGAAPSIRRLFCRISKRTQCSLSDIP